ncbi:DUF427 domain-containing protein [Jannaschia ovalis]|uniref:DUF427 domain-containing protein n=1 Tax=Jannaschia ovalis TaxID=3038773 RepID=A0ABY8L9I0_9RHOB|nr:DUF427 domain-containing protein [Jannaschia sp. GRR-S6-38]WGH78011.1 DUF427 domain-containing protein [Jannaschia sp. GRR-S6-38]
MAHIRVTPAEGVWTVRSDDGVIVESRNAKILNEGDMPFVVYFPRDDIALALFERSSKSTHCPHKGDASYFSYVGQSARIADVAWSYEDVTNPDAKDVEAHLAFDAGKVTVERV